MTVIEIIATMILNVALLQTPNISEVVLDENIKNEIVNPLPQEEAQNLFLEVQTNSCSKSGCSLAAHNF